MEKYLIKTDDDTLYELEHIVKDMNCVRTTLKPSKYGNWTEKGLKNRTIIQEDGNGADIRLNNRKFRLNYSEMFDLYVALRENHTAQKQGNYTRIPLGKEQKVK